MQQGNDPNQVPIESVGSGWSQQVQRLTWIFGDIIVSKNKKGKCTESPRVKRKQRVQHAMT
jgi:hypothetical protein